MKVFIVLTETDGETTREPGKVSTEIKRVERRYAAEYIQQVWAEIEHTLDLEAETLIAIIEEHPAITVLE
jgi:hypothetical protein